MRLARAAAVFAVALCIQGLDAEAPLVLHLEDYATAPMTGSTTGTGNAGSLARINMLREEPGGAGRFFVNDLNGPLYILDKHTKTFTTYLDFNGRDSRPGLFDKLPFDAGFANGFIAFQFDPDYRRNGKFYTIHLEEPAAPGSLLPDATSVPGLKAAGYAPTPPIATPGNIEREAIVIEWTDSNVSNTTFEGSARELMRVQLNTRIHPMGDLIFNPTARPGDADWRVLYIGCGDGGAGERRTAMRQNPQRLDTLVGKILRIVPDLALHTDTSTVSENGRYRIPRDNPFASTPGARKEIWAYGFRNPHRLTWDVDPADRANNHLLAASIGLHSWETVYVVHKGANYGYSEREGTEMLQGPDNTMAKLPAVDEIPVRISDTVTNGTVVPTYPVVEYPHTPAGGDAIAGGFVYRGKAVARAAGQIHFCGHLDRPHLVRGLQGDAGGRRWQAGDAGGDARCPSDVERAGRGRGTGAGISLGVPCGAGGIQSPRRSRPRPAGPIDCLGSRPRRRAVCRRRRRRTVRPQQGRRHDSRCRRCAVTVAAP